MQALCTCIHFSKPKALALSQNPINSKGSALSFCWRLSADVG